MKLPLSLQLQSSRWAITALAVMHALAISAIAVSAFAALLKIPLLLILAFSFVHGVRVHALRSSRHAVQAITLRAGNELELVYRDDVRRTTSIAASSTVLHWLIVLNLRDEKQRISLTLLPDMLDATSWRTLSVLLRAIKND